MNNKPILFFDSGVGGLPYLEEAIRRLPNERFVYLADRKYVPYGDKSNVVIKEAVFEALGRLFSRIEVKCAVIACNTASVVALSDLRKKYTMPFIGVVPAVKPAALNSAKKRFGVLATQRTVDDIYLKNLINNFAHNCEVFVVPAPDVVDLVENRFFTTTVVEKIDVLKKVVCDLKALEVDSVVLGCTHFLHLISEFKKALGNKVSLIDSWKGVVSQLVHILDTQGLRSEQKGGEHEFYLTGSPPVEPQYVKFAERFGLRFVGLIEDFQSSLS